MGFELNEMPQNLLEGAGSFLVIGYGLAFGEGSQFIGYSYFGLVGLPFEDYAFLFFQVKKKYVKCRNVYP